MMFEDVDNVLKRHKFEAIRQVLMASKKREAPGGYDRIEIRPPSLTDDVMNVSGALERWDFDSFTTRNMRLSKETVAYPLRQIIELAKSLYSRLAGMDGKE